MAEINEAFSGLGEESDYTMQNSKAKDMLRSGKKYDLFFSHSSKDEEWVKEIVEKLEAEPFNLKCAYFNRDFTPGEGIIDCILRYMEVSQGIVFVLSPSFVESEWCKYEVSQGLYQSIISNRTKILPVLYQQCEIPRALKHKRYIDATTNSPILDILRELQDALTSGKIMMVIIRS